MIKKKIPFVKKHIFIPLTAFVFILFVYFFVYLDFLPAQSVMVEYLKSIYLEHGPLILFVSVFIESIAYVGLYFPGSFIAFLIVIFSEGTFFEFFLIFVLSMFALFLGNIFNYSLGLLLSDRKIKDVKKPNRKHLLFYVLHPNLIAFHMFRCGIFKKGFSDLFVLSLFFMPYLVILIIIGFVFKKASADFVGSYFIVPSLLFIWFLFALYLDLRDRK